MSQDAALLSVSQRSFKSVAPELVISCSRTGPNGKDDLSHHPSP